MTMQRYVLMYIGWVIGVFTMAALAIAWYRHVEEIGFRAIAARLREQQNATDATEATESSDGRPVYADTDTYIDQ